MFMAVRLFYMNRQHVAQPPLVLRRAVSCSVDISPADDPKVCTDFLSLPIEGKVVRPQAETDEVVPSVCTEYL